MQFEINEFSREKEINKFLITYAITFSNFVLSFGSLLCRLQKHRYNV